MLRILDIVTTLYGKIGDMKYRINYKDKDVDDSTFNGVERHAYGNGNLYLWGPRYNGRDLAPIAIIPLDNIVDFSAIEEEDEAVA